MDRIPCRASAELRQHQADLDSAERITPDFTDADDLRQLVAAEIAEPLAAIFSTRDQILALQRSCFENFINHPKACEWLLDDLAALERALKHRWDAT